MKKIRASTCVLSGLVVLFFLGNTTIQLFKYCSLNSRTRPIIEDWRVVEKENGLFSIEALYQFSFLKKDFHGVTEFSKPYFLSEKAACLAVEALIGQDFFVFFNSNHPENSSLQKIFPFRLCIHFFLVAGAFVFFLVLQRCLARSFV